MRLRFRKERTLSIPGLPVVALAAGPDRITGRPGSEPSEHQKAGGEQMRPCVDPQTQV